jgi:mannose-6-phosphate isomerase-like protein (cupin superfamily)
MNRSRFVWILVLIPVVLGGQAPKGLQKNLFSHVMKSADVDAAFAKIQDSWDVFVKTNHAVTFRVTAKKRAWTNHQEADEYWIVRRGTAKVALAPTGTTSSDLHDVGAGDTVYVPRDLAYEIDPTAGRFEYVALRIFAPRPARGGGAGRGGAGGGAPAPEPTSYFATKAQIDGTFANETRTQQLRFRGGGSLNMIIYNGAIGPYESHEIADQIYFVRYGTAKAAYDGRLVDPKVTGPGQIRGTGYIDSSEYTIGPGDIVWIPRNQLHFVDPGTGKIGYLLAGIPTSQSALPPPPTSSGRGGQ